MQWKQSHIKDSSLSFAMSFEFDGSNRFRINEGESFYTFGQTFKNKNGIFKLIKKEAISPNEKYKIIWQPTRALASTLSSNVLVAPKGSTGILLLSLETTHPKLSADIINQLMQEYQESTILDKNETTKQTIEFIDDRLGLVSHELDSVTGALLAYQQANNIFYPETQSSSLFTRIDEFDKQINEQQVQVNIAQIIQNYLLDRKNTFSLVPSSLGIADPTLSTMIAAYNVAQLERKGLIDANVPAGNARVQQKEDQIERLRVNILENLRNLKAAYNAAVSNLEKKNSSVRSEIQSLPAKVQNLLEIKKQQETKQSVFNFLMERREESAITLAATISNMKVIEEAEPNQTPVSPNGRNIKIIAILVGLALPALIIFIIEMLNDKVEGRGDIEKLTAVPIIGEIGHSFEDAALVVKAKNRSNIGEQFRIFRSNLQYVLHATDKPVILVTSSFSGEGKSFISTNLGAVMALANKKTIVLEFDIRKPKVLEQLRMSKRPGLTNYLLGKITAEELPVPVEGHENLFVLPCGPVPPNPAELLLDPKIEELFHHLKQKFDVIIIDTAPVGIVSDAMTLSRFANATLYIVRQGRTFKKQIGLIDEFYKAKKLPKMSIILNDASGGAGYGGYGYGRYGYTYGYGSGYFEDETPQQGFFSRIFGRNKKQKTTKI